MDKQSQDWLDEIKKLEAEDDNEHPTFLSDAIEANSSKIGEIMHRTIKSSLQCQGCELSKYVHGIGSYLKNGKGVILANPISINYCPECGRKIERKEA